MIDPMGPIIDFYPVDFKIGNKYIDGVTSPKDIVMVSCVTFSGAN